MKKVITILSLVSMTLTVHAKSITGEAKQLADQIVAELNADNKDRAASRSNAKEYYASKLSLCLLEQDVKNALNQTKSSIDLKECSGVISQALSRGDLTESGVREVIDTLSTKRNVVEIESATRMERQKQIQIKANELVQYGNQKLN